MAITTQLNSGTPTAYAPLVAGTVASGPIQYATTGLSTSGNVLTSTGSSSLPTFQAVPGVTSSSTTTLSQAQIQGMYATPIQLIAAQGTHTIIVVNQVVSEYFAGSAFGGGGTVTIQYNNTVHGAGTVIVQPTISSVMSGTTSYTFITFPPAFASTSVSSNNLGVYISNLTGAFTGGANGQLRITIYYSVVTTIF